MIRNAFCYPPEDTCSHDDVRGNPKLHYCTNCGKVWGPSYSIAEILEESRKNKKKSLDK